MGEHDLVVITASARYPRAHTISSVHDRGRSIPHDVREVTLPQTGFIDHIGIGVPDLVAAKQYYDDLMSILGLREWFETSPGGPFNYGPDGD